MGRRAKPLPPLAELQRLFTYNPETGELLRKGLMAGCVVKTANTDYRQVAIGRDKYYAHRICWKLFYKAEPESVIDHIDGNGLNNTIANLRDVTSKINARNIKSPVKSGTGVRGVYWVRSRQSFVAKIGKYKSQLGYGDLLHCAALRKSAEQRLGYL